MDDEDFVLDSSLFDIQPSGNPHQASSSTLKSDDLYQPSSKFASQLTAPHTPKQNCTAETTSGEVKDAQVPTERVNSAGGGGFSRNDSQGIGVFDDELADFEAWLSSNAVIMEDTN